MRKKILSIVTIIAITLGTCTVALADEQNPNATRNALKSYGSVIYSDGANNSVEIYSDDLYTLADRLDTFKVCITDQLAALNTYFSSDGKGIDLVSTSNLSIVHTQPATATVDPLNLNFDTLLEGIAASQSIPTDISEYGYTNGTNLYKTTSGLLTVDGSQSNVEQINISAANSENLSAGSAAWVDGKLILGTGTDNQAYYNKGYADGFNKVMDSVNISYVYHKHVKSDGTESKATIYSTTNPGGCYVAAGHTHNSSCPMYHDHALDPVEYKPGCATKWVSDGQGGQVRVPVCEGQFEGYIGTLENGSLCHYHKVTTCNNIANTYSCGNKPINTWKIGCGKTEKTIESATIIFK